jgi:UDP-N-acetyl-2-amino-2-deoxyglucuronate dehydrogenase
MKIALVGTGTVSESHHIPILQSVPNVDLVAICDSNQKQLERVANKFRIPNKFTDVDSLLKSCDVDMIDIATPGFTHFDIARKAISLGINTLVEKPATLSIREAEVLEHEASRRNLKLGVCQTYRYREPIIELQKICKSGRFGTIDRMVSMHRGSTIFASSPWFWNEKTSGGILFEFGIHAIDLQCYLMGSPKEVLYATAIYEPTLYYTTSISAIVNFEHSIGIIDLKWFSSSTFFHQYISGSISDAIIKFYPDSLALQRSDFAPLSEFISELRRTYDFGSSVLRKRFSIVSQMPHRIIIEDFIRSVKANKPPLVPISAVIPTIRLAEEIWSKAQRS